MGLAVKLNAAFIIVILATALAQAGYSYFAISQEVRNTAKKTSEIAIDAVRKEIRGLQEKNGLLAEEIAKDPAFKQAVQSRDQTAIAKYIKGFTDRRAYPGYVTVVTSEGVLYSSETPNRPPGEPPEPISAAIFNVILGKGGQIPQPGDEKIFPGWICPISSTGQLTLANFAAIGKGSAVSGAVGCGIPIGSAVPIGIERKIELSSDITRGFDLVFFSMKDGSLMGVTNNLHLSRVQLQKLLPNFSPEKEMDGHYWRGQQYQNPATPGIEIARFYVGVPVGEVIPKFMVALGQIVVGAIVGILVAFLFTAGVASRFNASLKFLKQRAKDLAANKQDLRSLADLDGEWVELGEMMDTAVSAPRATVQNLKLQLVAKDEEIMEKQRQVDAINQQLEAVNRQITNYNRQAADVNNQISSANQQAVVVQQKLASVLQVSAEGYLMLDPFGSVVNANPVFLNWMGVNERELSGKLCFELVRKPGDPKDNGTPIGRPQSPHDLISYFYPEGIVYHRYNEKAVEVLIHLQPVVTDDGMIQGYIMVMRDKSVHSELSRLRSEIVHMLSDSIRGPLAASEARWASVMASQLQGLNPSVAKELVDLQKETRQMLGIVDSYLMMYGGFIPEPVQQREQVAITKLIGECLEHVAVMAKQHQITLDYKTVTGLPTTAISKDIVRDIIVQLLEKMISVTAPGGRVRAETTVRGKEIRLIVSSSGPAVHPTEVEDMFVGFIDGKHTEDTYQSRLNMYLARNNAERLGGKLWAEAEPGRGTAIFLTLPVH